MSTAGDATRSSASLEVERQADGRLVVRLAGPWLLEQQLPSAAGVEAAISAGRPVTEMALDASAITSWDTALPVFLWAVERSAVEHGIALDVRGLPEGARRLLTLAKAVPPPTTHRTEAADGWLVRIGRRSVEVWGDLLAVVSFLGEIILACGAWLGGRARYRRTDFALVLQNVGPEALPIVTLISFLVGVILAFVGAVQLASFGAQIFIADLVGLAMAREMGALMTAVIMTGRTGAAFAAQIGTMQVNQEVDALRTLGISPIEFLVLPRVLALVAMMPLLTLYAILVGMLGGMTVSVALFEITFVQYWTQTWASLTLDQFIIGLAKSLVFGALIAMSGCYQGIRAGGSASAVGAAATSAVVSAIVAIVVADGLFAVMLDALGV